MVLILFESRYLYAQSCYDYEHSYDECLIKRSPWLHTFSTYLEELYKHSLFNKNINN